jgi:hypothetical protein
MVYFMENGIPNIKQAVGEGFVHWNDPKYSGHIRISAFPAPNEYVSPWRTHYQIERQRVTLVARLRRLGYKIEALMDIDEALNDPGLKAVRAKDNQFILPVAHPACFHNPLRDRGAGNAEVDGTDSPAITPMPPEFELMYPRLVRWSSWCEQPAGGMAHFSGSSAATPEQEAWYRINAPERGLDPNDLIAYRKSQRGPVARFVARLKFWPSKAKDEWDLDASNLAWVSNYRDWNDVFRDVWGFFCKPLRLLKRWFG